MARRGKTPVRGIRIDTPTWDAAQHAADARNENLPDAIRAFLIRYASTTPKPAAGGRDLWTITGPGITCYGFDLPAARLFSDGTAAERRSADGTMDRRQVAEVSDGRTWLTWDDAFGWIGAGGAGGSGGAA